MSGIYIKGKFLGIKSVTRGQNTFYFYGVEIPASGYKAGGEIMDIQITREVENNGGKDVPDSNVGKECIILCRFSAAPKDQNRAYLNCYAKGMPQFQAAAATRVA